jgi:hypothetical protein
MDWISSCVPITTDCDGTVNYMAFDGCAYYCTIQCGCEIVKFDACLNPQHSYDTCRQYDCLCYDWYECCFWASSTGSLSKIYKLDRCMNEIDCIDLSRTWPSDVVTGISFNGGKNSLIVSLTGAVLELDKEREKAKIFYTTKKGWIMGVCALCPGLIVTLAREGKQELAILDWNGELLDTHTLEGCSRLKNLLFTPCTSGCPRIEALIFKKCVYPYLCRWRVSLEELGFVPCPARLGAGPESGCAG